MAEKQLGKLKPRYSFMLNPHEFERVSKCPTCRKLTYPRKFALLIHVQGFAPLALGKTCKYCPKCELMICHQHELDAELAHFFQTKQPELIGNEYVVLGTVDLEKWKAGLASASMSPHALLDCLADFKKYMSLDVDPGGRRPPDADPAKFIIKHGDAERCRDTPWTRGRRSSP
jgi:hypothetical protein